MTKLKYRATFERGMRGELPEVLYIKAANIVAAGRAWGNTLGKQGYHALYCPSDAILGWGQFLMICNRGAAATYRIDGVS